jgi:hypothetical protein
MAQKSRGRSLKTSRKCRVAVDWNTLSRIQNIHRVFAVFKLVTGCGADGSIMGASGSINAVSANLILDSHGVNGKVVCDLEAADGTFMFPAFFAGAQRVFGVEFAENIGYRLVLEAAVRRIKQQYDIKFNLDRISSAIEEVGRRTRPLYGNSDLRMTGR